MVDTCPGYVGMRLHHLLWGHRGAVGLDLSGLRPFQNPMKAIPLWPAKGMHAQDGSHVATPRSPAGALELGSPAEEGVLG